MTSHIFHVHRSHLGTTRTYETEIIWDAPETSLIAISLAAMARSTVAMTVSSSTVSQLRRFLRSSSELTRSLLCRPPSSFSASPLSNLLASAFKDLEERSDYSLSAKQQLFRSLAVCINHCEPPLISGDFLSWMEQQLLRFRRAPRTRSLPLLEAIPRDAIADGEINPSAISSVRKPYDAIEDACRKEVDAYNCMVRDQETLLGIHRKSDIAGLKNSPCSRNIGEELSTSHSIALQKFISCAESGGTIPKTPLKLTPSLRGHYHCITKSALPWLLARYKLPNATLHAIFILVSLRTGWNPQSVASLSVDGITSTTDGGFLLQSRKNKTDDATPPVIISRNDKLGIRCIRLLLHNLEGGKLLKLANQDEKRLWIGWSQRNSNRQIAADGSALASFIARYNLPKFCLKDLRSLKVSIAFISNRDLDQVRLILGHKSFASVDSYLRSTVIFKMNEANIIRFQQQIEQRLMEPDTVVDSMLSTGDGGFCADSSSARFGPARIPCEGFSCHVGSQCPNYRISPSKKSVSDALMTLDAYKACWQALVEQQPDAAWELHLPRIIYIQVLLRIVHDLRPDLLIGANV